MSSGRFVAAVAIAGVVAVVGAMTAYVYCFFIAPGIQMGQEVVQAKTRLLSETDHQALLEACRELSRQVMNAEFKEVVYKSTEALRLSEPIPALRPNHVTIGQDGLVKIEMYTGRWPLGVWAFPEGREKPSAGYGDRKLLDGLWYYEDGYSLDPEAYDKTIDRLLSKNPKRKKATSESDPNSEHLGK